MTQFAHQYEVGRFAHKRGEPWDESKNSDWQAGWEEEEAQSQQQRRSK